MPEFRQNIATKEWVIIAPERAKRPEDFKKKKVAKEFPEYDKNCPFCIGNEDKTPPSVYSIKKNGKWNLRVVPNKFAALKSDLSPKRKKEGKSKRYLTIDGFGLAEVVIETSVHNKTIATMNYSEVRNVIKAYKQRYIEISKNEDIRLITIFRNHGAMAGTSLEHPHSQIIATPVVPPHVRDQIFQARIACDTFGTCIYCDMIKQELSEKKRIIIETDHFVAFSPYAARSPFETRIIPKRHDCSFDAITEKEIDDFSKVLRNILRKIYLTLDNPDYNYIIRSSPTDERNTKHYHWYAVIIPKLTTPAGFEIGTGIYINVIPPEESARFLRQAKI
jgi:UDPglucose--hexose-1-phosphate uridylyltransferase